MGYFEEAGTGFNIITFKNGKQEKIKVKPYEVEEIVKHQSLKGGLKNERL